MTELVDHFCVQKGPVFIVNKKIGFDLFQYCALITITSLTYSAIIFNLNFPAGELAVIFSNRINL